MQEQGRHRHNVMESDMGEQWVTSNEDAVMSGGRNGYNQKWMHNSHGQPHNQVSCLTISASQFSPRLYCLSLSNHLQVLAGTVPRLGDCVGFTGPKVAFADI